jgi:hypothetical protein
MKKITPTLVFVEDIYCDKPRSDFLEVDLNESAKLILMTGSIVNPLVLRKTGVESYAVIDGYFEYWTAVRAREIDPLGGEVINAYIMDSEEDEKLLREQISMFRDRGRGTTAPVVTSSENVDVMRSLNGISRQLAEMSNHHSKLLEDIPGKLTETITVELSRQVDGLSKEISSEIAKQFSEFRLLMEEVRKGERGISGKQAGSKKTTKLKLSPEVEEKIKGLAPQKFVEALNTLDSDELERKLRISKPSKTVIESILVKKREQPFQEFETYLDVMKRVDGLGSTGAKMLELLQKWSKVFP